MALGVLLGVTGCETSYPSMTCKLWTSGVLRNFNEPAPDTAMEMFTSWQPRDILVTYDEVPENKDTVRRRAFYLFADLDRVNSGRKPRFVSPTRTNGLALLTVVTNGVNPRPVGTNAAARIEISVDGHHLSVVDAHGERTDFQLPTYETRGGTVARVALTPFAVVGDTAVAVVAVGVFTVLAWGPALANR